MTENTSVSVSITNCLTQYLHVSHQMIYLTIENQNMNYSANKMAAKHCLSAQCIVVDIVPLMIQDQIKTWMSAY